MTKVTDLADRATNLVVHAPAKYPPYTQLHTGTHEHRYCSVFGVSARKWAVIFVPISVVIVQVNLSSQLVAKRVALLYGLPRTLGLLHSLQFGFFLPPGLFS